MGISKTNIIIQPGKRIRAIEQPVISSSFLKNYKAHNEPSKKISTSFSQKKIKPTEVLGFSEQLSALIDAGIPIVAAISMVIQQTKNARFRKILEQVRDDINGGASLKIALSRYPGIFSSLYIAMIEAAEVGGQLAKVLIMLSQYLKTQHEQSRKMRSAIVYPRFVMIFFLILVVGVLFGLMPEFKETFASLGSELPGATEFLLNVSQVALDFVWLEVFCFAACWISFNRFKKKESGKRFMDRLYLKIPYIKGLIAKSSLSRFCRILAICLSGGVPFVKGLEIATKSADNSVFRDGIEKIRLGVLKGESFAATLESDPIFPDFMVKMISTGEQASALEKMLNNIANLYDSQIDSEISVLSSILEPLLMIGLGIIAVIIIIALYLPIFNMGNLNF